MAFIQYQHYPAPHGTDPFQGPVRRRHVLFIQGLFPQGPAYYYDLLKKQLQHYAKLYGMSCTCSGLVRPYEHVARCEIEARQEDRSINVVYDFLDWEDIVRSAHQRSLLDDLSGAVRTVFNHFTEGTFIALARAHWKFAIAWLFPYILFTLIAVTALAALYNLLQLAAGSDPAIALPRILLGSAITYGLWRLSRLYWCGAMLRNFNFASRYARDLTPELEQRIDIFADIIAKTCKASQADEILIVGHSFAGQLAIRAALGAFRKGAFSNGQRRIKLLTVGDATCHTGLMKGAGAARTRNAVIELAQQQNLPWVLIYGGKDVLAFNKADPPSTLRAFEGYKSSVKDFFWPLMHGAHFREALAKKDYRRLRWRFFHIHGQYIMAARLKSAPFDYIRAVCGSIPLPLTGKRQGE